MGRLSSEVTDNFDIDLREVFDHQLCNLESREVSFAGDCNAIYTSAMSCLYSGDGVFDDEAVGWLYP
ncbi:hypothetical protein KSZ_40630 [Dictyobacter formicarum]|uniref:Uncharacterized protein n=1 Tax=Dictyobacter formicarum TaxID=2778368 RepID=A0ABQ3VIT8_9CHLR|nr:hypothetical protein KSZ_40630 [Dictyobacter formicarum]